MQAAWSARTEAPEEEKVHREIKVTITLRVPDLRQLYKQANEELPSANDVIMDALQDLTEAGVLGEVQVLSDEMKEEP